MARSEPYLKHIQPQSHQQKTTNARSAENIMSLFVIGVDETIREDDLRYEYAAPHDQALTVQWTFCQIWRN
jgi:uncharacterized protein (DUF1800 family)